jgi:uncharacterized protein (DUF1800 family)
MRKKIEDAYAMKPNEETGDDKFARNGSVHEGDFVFIMNRHDSKPKKVLGHNFTTGDYQEGVELLKLLAHHPATAKFISRKLAAHFVSDTPPQILVDKMAKTFFAKQWRNCRSTKSNGECA